jgi:MoxR-like ATPase
MSNDLQLQEECVKEFAAVRESLHQNIVGMDRSMDALFWTALCSGHSLLVGVPGLAKTLIISSFSELLGLHFKRVQFTPDMMPSDLIGSEVLQEDAQSGRRQFEFRKGPIFCQILLADEINRTPPKTQAALLQVMQERQVSYSGVTHELQMPFIVFATQNPIESEGTYPLPEAQLDRFLFSIPIDYPSAEEEVEIVKRTTSPHEVRYSSLIEREKLLAYQDLVKRIPIDESLMAKAVDWVRSTRPEEGRVKDIQEIVRVGAGPRASQALVLGAKARALLSQRQAVREEDLREVAPFVLEHRLVMKKFRSKDAKELIQQILR